MKTSSNPIDDFNVEITVTIPSNEVDEKFNENLDEALKNVDIPGFRKGKAPRNLQEKQVDKDKIWQYTRQDLIDQTLQDAIREADVHALAYDDIHQEDHAPGDDFTYKVKIRLMPDIPDFEYKNIPVKIPKAVVTEEHIDNAIENLRINWAESNAITIRPAQEGDWALIYLVGNERNRIKLPGQSDEPKQLFPPTQLSIEIGGKRGIDWLDKEIVGMRLKETKTAHLTMPKDFINPPLEEDTEIEAKIMLLHLEEKKLPEITDDYLADNNIAKDLNEFREKVREELQKQAKQAEDKKAMEVIQDWLIENVEISLPDDIIEAKQEEITEQLRQEYHRHGHDLDNLMKRVDDETNELRDQIKKQAVQSAKLDFIIPHIAQKEELEVTQPEIINHIQMVAQMSQIKKHQLKKLMEDEGFLIHAYRQILNRKVTNFLLNHAKREYIEEQPIKPEETGEPTSGSIITP